MLYCQSTMILIEKISLPIEGIEDLHAEASREGYSFIDTLIEEWTSETNRFTSPGEALCGHMDRGKIVAVGGLTIDPFVNDVGIGRIRRVYVRPNWRGQGVGRTLVRFLMAEARLSFRFVRLRAENGDAARLYESLGFVPLDDPNATHIFSLQ